MATVRGYCAQLGRGRFTHFWAIDDADAERQANRAGAGFLSLKPTGDELQVPDPVDPAALAMLQEVERIRSKPRED
jgi:hypothetical protein